MALRVGPGRPLLDVARARRDCLTTDSLGLPSEGGGVLAHSQCVEQPAQNWSGQGESDCLIKTKQSDGRKPMLTLCDFCPVL